MALTAACPRTVHVEHGMGTVFSIDIRDPGSWDEAISDVVAFLNRADALFSTYQPGSDVMRIRRGELAVKDADPAVGEVLELCEQLAAETGGYFTATWNGRFDPTGAVKGWAIERVSRLLRARGSNNHAVNGGGDMQLAGEASPGQPWRVGVSDPLDRTRVLAVLTGRDIAVATSGNSERGAHIINPFTATPAAELASATITGPALSRADAYATAAFAMGPAARTWIGSLPAYEALIVSADGTMTSSFSLIHLDG
jgi:thiamine biosynthesis lipoprotein